MTTKIVFLFDESGESRGPYEAQESPLERGEFLTPVLSTDISPPVTGEAEAAVFSQGGWSVVPDLRGRTYFDAAGRAVVIDALGAVPAGLTAEPPPPSTDLLAASVRAQRAALLATCDWTVLPDAPLTAEQVLAWKAYRQGLRDITSHAGFPLLIEWPAVPAAA